MKDIAHIYRGTNAGRIARGGGGGGRYYSMSLQQVQYDFLPKQISNVKI